MFDHFAVGLWRIYVFHAVREAVAFSSVVTQNFDKLVILTGG